jgi:hypothetical protein
VSGERVGDRAVGTRADADREGLAFVSDPLE